MQKLAQTLIRWEWLVLLALIPVALFPSAATTPLLLLIPLFWLLRRLAEGRFVTATPYDLAIFGLLLMVGISMLVVFDSEVSSPKIAGILLGVALFYGAVAFCRRGSQALWTTVFLVVAVGAGMAVVGLIGSEWLPPFDALNELRTLLPFVDAIPGTVGGLVNANELAGVLSWVAPLMLGCLLALGRRRVTRRAALVGPLLAVTLLTGFVLVATLSRGGILAAGVGLATVVIFYSSPRWRLVLIIATVVAVSALYAYSSRTLQQSLLSDPLGFGARAEIWSRALEAIGDASLTGVGVNAFRRVVHTLYPLYTVPAGMDLGHAHNHLMQAALDLGLPGLVCYLAIWLLSAAMLWQTGKSLIRRHAARHPYYGLVAGLSGSMLAGWIFGIFDAVALGARPSFLWWLLLGLIAAVHHAVLYSGERLRRRRPGLTVRPVVSPVDVATPFPVPPLSRPRPTPQPPRPTAAPGRYTGAPDPTTSQSSARGKVP